MEILSCKDVTKVYKSKEQEVHALNGVSFSVDQGEFVVILGASGSGKSTLLHILGTVDHPSSGTVLIQDTDLSNLSNEQSALFRRRKVGIIYQFYNLIPTLNVERNIKMPMLLDKREPDMQMFEQVVSTLGLAGKLSAMPNQLSGGQQQRAAIARALLYRPAIILADEPTGNLDQKNSREIVDLLKLSCRQFQQTIILITHDESIALQADHVITLQDGKIISDRRQS